MSIIRTNKQIINYSKEKKEQYGEIFTPYSLIEKMLNLLNEEHFTNPNTKWLDPGSGTGFFSIYLYWKLFDGLKNIIPNETRRKKHIIENMIYMVEIQEQNTNILKKIFGLKANIFNVDFLIASHIDNYAFDYVIGNPPYNINGVKKVPTNKQKNKKNDGNTVWFEFIKKSIQLLKENGNLIMVVPCIWLKPDKLKAYDYMCNFKIEKLHSHSNTDTKKIFNGNAQTPTSYFLLKNTLSNKKINIFDNDKQEYFSYKLITNYPIPMFGINLINKIMYYVEKYGHLDITKTNMPHKNVKLSPMRNNTYKYKNINSCKIDNIENRPTLDVKYSNTPCNYYKEIKLVLPHKMYGFPYIDMTGSYGICNRDNYVILDNNINNLQIICEFLSTKTALYIYESTRYRMKYLEKYAFNYIPNILKIDEFIKNRPITDESISKFFNFDSDDVNNINKLHKKNYNFNYLMVE
tara:strand:- start:12282 stop:13670 length:1389 start_codon:yes stop_codon:yes gene_type:complete